MSKKPTASSDRSASGFTASVAAGAQAGVNLGNPTSAIGGKGSYSYISGLAGKNLAFRQLTSGLTTEQNAKIAEIIATTARVLVASTNSGNSSTYVDVLAAGLAQINSIIGSQDIANNQVWIDAFNAIIAGQSYNGIVDLPLSVGAELVTATTATITPTTGFVPGSAPTVSSLKTMRPSNGIYTTSGATATTAIEKSSGVTTGFYSQLVPLDPVTKLPKYAAQFFPTDLVVDYATGNTIYVSDEKQFRIRRIIPGEAASPPLSYPVVQTIYLDYSNAQPRGIKFDTVNKFVYSSLTTSNKFYIYSTGVSKGYAVEGKKTTAGLYLDVLGVDVVGNMYYVQYSTSGGSRDLGAVNYIYKYNPIKNTHTLLTNESATGTSIVQPAVVGGMAIGTNWTLGSRSISPAQIVFAEKSIAYAVLLPRTFVTISLDATTKEITASSTVTVVANDLSGYSNISYIASCKGASDGNTYLYYYYTGINTIYRISSANSHDISSKVSVFGGSLGYSGNGGQAGSARTNFLYGFQTAQPTFTFDVNGNMYFADVGNTVIRKLTRASGQQAVDSTSIVSYVAGTPNPSPNITSAYPINLPTSAEFNGDILPFKATV